MEGLVLSTGILLHLKYKYKVAEKTKATVFIHRAAIDYYYFCKYALCNSYALKCSILGNAISWYLYYRKYVVLFWHWHYSSKHCWGPTVYEQTKLLSFIGLCSILRIKTHTWYEGHYFCKLRNNCCNRKICNLWNITDQWKVNKKKQVIFIPHK